MLSTTRLVSAIDQNIRARLASSADLSPAEIVELIVRDLESHWHRCERVPVETYLAALASPVDADVQMDLIYAEILAREAVGDRPGPAEYTFRFPDLAERIRTQFLLHRTLLDEPKAESVPVP